MDNKKKEEISNASLCLLLVVIFILVGWSKWNHQIVSFIYRYRHPLAAVAAVLIVSAVVKLRDQFIKFTEDSSLEKDVVAYSSEDPSVFMGKNQKGRSVFLKLSSRRMHTQVVGTTNAGKTESVIAVLAVDDIKEGRGLLIIDGKSDRSLLNKIYGYAKKYGREQDVRILSLCNTELSHTFNPLEGGSVLEVTERVFNALNFENEYFKSIQYDALLHCLMILQENKIKATPLRVIELLTSEAQMSALTEKVSDERLQKWGEDFKLLKREEREQRTSGLISQLQSFTIGEIGTIFNAENSEISLETTLEQGQIVYCQLPALKIPTLGKATGKMILQCLQSAVASRHVGTASSKNFFSVYLDDFTEYLTPSFVTLLNKSRSANVGITFAHQALGDLEGIGEGVKNTILTNSNLKIFMRTNEPESAEYFSSVIGTSLTSKVTERQTAGFLGPNKTGDGSVRETEEFKFHPNLFKQNLGVGEAVMVIPHAKGSLPVNIKFQMTPALDDPLLPTLKKSAPRGLSSLIRIKPAHSKNQQDKLDTRILETGPDLEKTATHLVHAIMDNNDFNSKANSKAVTNVA